RRVKLVREPAGRQGWWGDRKHLVQVSVPDGVTRRLTAGPVRPDDWSISPDGERLLFLASEQDLTERPFFSSELWELDLASLEARRLLSERWIGGAAYDPRGGDLLALTGSPSAFDGLGRNLPAGMPANDYGGQVYLYDRATGQARALTREFDPAVTSLHWSSADRRIYVVTADRQEQNLYVLDVARLPAEGAMPWRRVPTALEVTRAIDLAADAPRALAWGSGASIPPRLQVLDLPAGRPRTLLDPAAHHYEHVSFGAVEDWTATLPDGEVLDGRVYYPRDFDPQRRYPVIVYYYGGTSPVERDYGGRYPKEVWAGQGYLVYVPQPSGAIGYGQEFAARHVNDWGKRTAWEVIEGTRAFLAAHPFADAGRMACIGASYGGFLTQYIVTQTDQFAAAVSHAGISSISSYWGEGLWGYVYGARALADAFPWRERDLYVQQSPLFLADRIQTPLLLLHGTGDTNVPVGESDQLFTALKLLGREVEYVQVAGQDHHILDHDQRVVWNDTILAYFARYLKDRPQWWRSLYPDPDRAPEEASAAADDRR
ncbi:MAG: prolyl oligopeptidase family serine peptidase, partial [Candidatus Krumholzibacteriia bacterium]